MERRRHPVPDRPGGCESKVIHQHPVRTCIGCRQRATATELLRVVVAPDAAGGPGSPGILPLVPDPRRRIQGRGAWLHRDLGCAELAQRRRAFARALHVPHALDPGPVLEYLATHYGESTTSGTPQEN